MSPNVMALAPYVDFDAAAYTWIDLIDQPKIPHEELEKKFHAKGVNPTEHKSFREISLPFEKFVLLPPEHEYGRGGAFTVERTPDQMIVQAWQAKKKGSNFTVVARPSDTDDPRDVLTIQYDPRLPVAKRGRDVARDMYVDMMKSLMAHVAAFCVGAYGEQHQVYQGTGSPTNAKRIKKNKLPMYDWHTVVIETSQSSGESKGGTHATPRLHDVRGHWVKSKLGKTFWRKAHRRGDATKGVIFHDYVTSK